MGGHNPKQVKPRFPESKKRKVHMHGCKGYGKAPCPRLARVECDGILSHRSRCPPCDDKSTKSMLFGTPASDFITG